MKSNDFEKVLQRAKEEFTQNWDGKDKLFKNLINSKNQEKYHRWIILKKMSYAFTFIFFILASILVNNWRMDQPENIVETYTFEDFEAIYEVASTLHNGYENEQASVAENNNGTFLDEVILPGDEIL